MPYSLFAVIVLFALLMLTCAVDSTARRSLIRWQPLNEPGCGGAMTAISVSPHDSSRILIAGDMLGVGLSEDRGESWQSTYGFGSWEIADFTWHPADPNIIWVGTMSGPCVSHDGGRNWQPRRNGLPPISPNSYSAPVEKVLFHPEDPNHLLAFGGSSRRWSSPGNPLWGVVWESRDGGESWARLTTITPTGSSDDPNTQGDNITFAAYAPGDPSTLYATADKAGFLVSTDGGKTWERRNNGLPPVAPGRVAVHPTDKNTLWMGVSNHLPEGAEQRIPGGVFKTTDGGKTWSDSSEGIKRLVAGTDGNLTTSVRAVAVAPSDPNILYANDHAWTTGTTYRSDDGGKTWRMVVSKHNIGHDSNDPDKQKVFQLETAYPAGLGATMLVVDPNDPNAVYSINTEFIARTLDGGKTWNDATSFRPDPVKPNAWRGRGYSGLCSTNIELNPFRKGHAIVQAMDAAQAWISEDDLHSWTHHHTPETAWSGGTDASFCRDGTIYVAVGPHGWFGIGRSTDGSETWNWLVGPNHGLPESTWGRNSPSAIYAHPEESQKVWAIINRKLYHSADAGEHWSIVLDRSDLEWMAADPNEPSRMYVSSKAGVFTSDGGSNFSPIGGPRPSNHLTVDAKGRLYVVSHEGERGGLWRYEGKTWTRLRDDPAIKCVTVDPRNPNRIAVSTNSNPYHDVSRATGVWISGDAGQSWTQANDGLAMLRGWTISFDPHDPQRLIFGAFGRGFFIAHWPKTYIPAAGASYRSTGADDRFAVPKPPEEDKR